ncbi:hypothetical protein [Arthrobacter cupressi]|uniref:Uncharacterized protein n=1 Tax=Arthrobacter cupressi TaxID=1045773 RepID=A0A1G8QFT9_9MICC|nr:hypothetical protein [Arthrobacter cupressi]NYD78131.1 hypothetical protein [Arthrobacter cupressi]SDJ03659.1 hypothetical protein SAMN05216555_106169 [Arthrobacter cupressi]
MKKSRIRLALERVLAKQRHVIIRRRLKGADELTGYVLAVGKSWLLLAT